MERAHPVFFWISAFAGMTGSGKRKSIMGIFDFLKGGGQRSGGKSEPPVGKETRSYDELIDEIMEWNVGHTDILDVLRKEIEAERLTVWSHALEVGVKKGLTSASGKVEEAPLFLVFLDLYKFVIHLRARLLSNPTMKDVRRMGKSDSLTTCIICGIRALQKESGAKQLLNSIHWILLVRYLSNLP